MTANKSNKNKVPFSEQIAKAHNCTSRYVRAVVSDVNSAKYKSEKAQSIRAAYNFHQSSIDLIINSCNK